MTLRVEVTHAEAMTRDYPGADKQLFLMDDVCSVCDHAFTEKEIDTILEAADGKR